MKAKNQKRWKNVFISFQHSEIRVQLAIPDADDENGYDVMMQEASEIIAKDLGIPVSLLSRFPEEPVVHWR
jgi:hypothetical protein